MGALYEDVEAFFGIIFTAFGRFIARYPVVFIVVSLITSGLLGLGLINIQYETSIQKLYTPMRSQAHSDQDQLEGMFPDNTRDGFYDHQLIWLDTYGEVIVTAKDEGNVLRGDVIKDVVLLHKDVLGMTIDDQDRGHAYKELCATRNGVCIVDGEMVMSEFKATGCIEQNVSFPFLPDDDNDGFRIDLRYILGGITFEDNCTCAKALRLKYNLKHDTTHQRALSLLWERKFLQTLSNFESSKANFFYGASESLDIELADHVGLDIKFFSLTIIMMAIYASAVSTGGDWVSTRILLGLAGIIAALLGILASFGLLSLCGVKFVDICGVMPFLILGLGVDDMFILMSGYRRTNIKLSIEERIAETYKSSAISVTMTSLTNMLAFCIGATSPFLSIKNFCIFAGVAVFICYFNQLTFFGGCLVLHARRVEASRHCFTCLKVSNRRELEEQGAPRSTLLFCCGETPKKAHQDESICERIPTRYLPKFLMQIPTKVFIIGLFIIYVTASAIGTSKLQTGLKLQTIVPENSYLAQFYEAEHTYFTTSGPHVMLVVTRYVDYRQPDIKKELDMIFNIAYNTGYVNKGYNISWLNTFLLDLKEQVPFKEPQQMEEEEFFIHLKTFLKSNPVYKQDILWNADKTNIEATRFYIRSKHFTNSSQERDMMTNLRHIADNASLPLMAYCPDFVFYEHYVSIMKDTLLAVGIAVIGMLFMALAFIPHPVSITCVLFTMLTIVLGMFGFMYFWGLHLSAITSVQIILSVGFCVDFTVHISHAFMAAAGKNRNQRVVHALEKVGVPILNGALSSILGILMLAFANSYVYKSFFQTMLLVVLLGLGHSLLLLPVVLSLIGPRRTGKPRIFIPISNDFKMGVQSPPTHTSSIHHHDSQHGCSTPDHKPSLEQNTANSRDTLTVNNRAINAAESMELIRMESPQDEKIDLLTPVKRDRAHGYLLEEGYEKPISKDKSKYFFKDSSTDSADDSLLQQPSQYNDLSADPFSPNPVGGEMPELTGSEVTQNVFPQQLEARDLLVHINDSDQLGIESGGQDHSNPFLGQKRPQAAKEPTENHVLCNDRFRTTD